MHALRAGLLPLLLLGTLSVQAAGPWAQAADGILPREVPDSAGARAPKRWLAAVLTLAVGPFGGHRMYLGTRPAVPVIYAVTFGGFGVLVLIDLGHILFTHDMGPFRGNEHVFMWRRDNAPPVTPP